MRAPIYFAKIHFRKLVWANIFLLAAVCLVRAELLPIKTYLSSDGLVYDKIYNIHQDSRGFIWISTPNGISRFDGYKFVNYSLENGLEDTLIHDSVEDGDGVIWFGTSSSGVYRFDPRKQSSEIVKKDFELIRVAETVGSNRVFRFCKTQNGRIYAATFGGVYLLDAREKTFSRIELNLPQTEKDFQVLGIVEDASGSLWVGHQFGLSRLTPDNLIINYEVAPLENGKDTVRSLAVDRENRVWLVTEKQRAAVFNPEPLDRINASDLSKRKLNFIAARKFPDALPANSAYFLSAEESFADGSFTAVSATSDGSVWLSAYGKGLLEFVQNEFRFYTQENGLSNNTVRNISEDEFGNLWIASDWGAMKFTRSGFTTYRTADGLPDERIASILQDKNDALYVVTPNWNVSRFDGRKFQNTRLNLPEAAGYLNDRVISGGSGEWWFATGAGLYRFGAVKNFEALARAKPSAVYTSKNGLPTEKIRVIYEDSKGRIWFSYDDKSGVLSRLNPATNEIKTFGAEHGIPPSCVGQIFREDRNGVLYVACFAENILVFRDEKFSAFTNENFVKGYWISDIIADKKNRLWVATPTRGLLKIENLADGNPQVRVFTNADGLSSLSGQFLTDDSEGNIYLTTASGLDVVDPETEKIKTFTIAEVNSGFGNGVAFRARSGELWFGAHRGISRFKPQKTVSRPPSPVYISGVRVSGEAQPISSIGETEISDLTLDSDRRQIQIDFFGLSLATGEILRYQYKLENSGDEWSAPDQQRTVNYPNVPPGSYRFLVRAVNSDGAASENPAVVSFTVLRPVWQRWWFLLIFSLIAAAIIYSIYRYRIAQIIKLERVRTRIATDLHDDIGSSLSKIAILSEVVRQKNGANGNDKNEPLEIIANTSREMVDSMSDIVWAINPERDHLSDLIQRMRRFAEELLDAQDMDYRFILPENMKDISVGADLRRDAYLIFKECINNVAKHSGAAETEIKINYDSDILTIEIKDDGDGFDVAEKLNGKQTGFGGNGLPNMKKRVTNLGGEFQIESEIGKGTRTFIRIPTEKSTLAGIAFSK